MHLKTVGRVIFRYNLASSNHGRTFLNFDSSPAQTHLEFNGWSSNLHPDGGHGGDSAVFPPSGQHDTGSVHGDYDYATYDHGNYPQWHQDHLASHGNYPQWHQDHLASSQHENAAQPFWSALGQQQPMGTHLPAKFDSTHSIFGSMFTKGSPNAETRGTPPPVATANRPGSTVDTTSRNTTAAGEAERTTVPTSTEPGVRGDHDNKALQNGAPFVVTATGSRVLQTVGIAEATTTGSPPTVGKLRPRFKSSPRNESQDVTTTQGHHDFDRKPRKSPGCLVVPETTTNSPPATSTPIDGVSKNPTAMASTRAAVDDGSETPAPPPNGRRVYDAPSCNCRRASTAHYRKLRNTPAGGNAASSNRSTGNGSNSS
ncbi:hypothetical protein MTO96_008885 [Rhipicephalus appendiculatus]